MASYGSLLLRLGVTFVARMVMARLVIPDSHGVYDLALRIIIVASAVRDLGLPFHLMRDERRPYGTVLAFSLASGVVVTGAVMIAAPLAGVLTPELPEVLRVFALWIFLDGLVQVPKTFFERELAIGRMVWPEIARGIVVAAVSIPLAAKGFGAWSFVYADLAAALIFAILVWRRAWPAMPRRVRWKLVPDLLRRSRYLFLIWIVFQLVTYIDLFIVEVFGNTATVAQYNKAYWIAFLVPLIVAPRALLPALVEYRHHEQRFLETFRVGTAFLMFFQVTAGYYLFFNAEKVVEIILGEQWGPAVGLLRVLAFVPFLDVFTDLGGEVLKVREEDRTWLLVTSVNLASLLIFGILFTRRWGAMGMAWANFLLVGNFLMAWRMARIFGPGFRQVAADLARIYLLPLPFFLAVTWLTDPGGWGRFWLSWLAVALAAAALAPRFVPLFRLYFGHRREDAYK